MKHRAGLIVAVLALAIAVLAAGIWIRGGGRGGAATGADFSSQPGRTGASAYATAPSSTPTATPTASIYAGGETAFQTPRGLRFADETTYEWELLSATTFGQETEALRRFVGEYGLTLSVLSGTPSSYAEQYATWSYLSESDAQDLKTYGALFIDEWSKYPKAWVDVSGVTTIALVKDLEVDGTARSAMPDPIGEALYLDVGAADLGAEDDYDYARGAIHHELDHNIEYAVFGTYSRADTEWTLHNPSGFEYGSGGASWYDGGDRVNTAHPESGFVDAYATSAIEEDKAETYAYLFVDRRHKLLDTWTGTDAQLAGKVAEYQAFIEGKVPFMDDAYFTAINP